MAQKPLHIAYHMGKAGSLGTLLTRQLERQLLVNRLRASLPQDLAARCCQASIEGCRLNVGVTGPVWADRLRRSAKALVDAANTFGVTATSCRIYVIPLGDGASEDVPQSRRRARRHQEQFNTRRSASSKSRLTKAHDQSEVAGSLLRLHRSLSANT